MQPSALPARIRRALSSRAAVLGSDLRRFASHGRAAPRRFQLIHVDPRACRTALDSGMSTTVSGHVVPGDWDLDTRPIEAVKHIAMALSHWRDGVPWADTGAYENMLELVEARGGVHQGAHDLGGVVRRYEKLDETFDLVRREGRLRTRKELTGKGIREHGGVLMHLGRDAQPIYNGWTGCHRIAMALALDLPVIPAMIGAVHPGALPTWKQTYLPAR